MKAVKGICKNLINTVIVCIMAAILFSVMTFCWLADTGNTFVMKFNSSTASAYFAGGNGSKNEPYKISTPVHMYNFAWLQYLGYFNLKDNFNNGRAQSFFELTDNIDMSSIAIPPIGTREYPFIGYFNGNGKTVYNVTVSNSEADFTRRPSTAQFKNNVLTMADSKFTNVDIVGLFGVTGDFNSFIANSYEKKNATTGKKKTVLVNGVPTEVDIKNKEESTGTTTSNKLEPLPSGNTAENVVYYSGMNVNSMYIDKITVKSVSPKTLVGLAAGYISSTMQDVGVYRSKVSVSSDTDGGVSGITTVKGTVKEYGTTISEYSLVGDYDEENVGWTEVPTDGSGDSAAWGGSIDMRTLNRRLTYIQNSKKSIRETASSNYYPIPVYNSGFNFCGTAGTNNSPFLWNTTKQVLSNLYSGTVLPLNIDKSAMLLDKATDGNTNEKYNNGNSEILAKMNTGYIVGNGNKTNNFIMQTIIRPLRDGTYASIPNSFSATGTEYVTSEFAMLTVIGEKTTNGYEYNTYRIVDDYNKTKYEADKALNGITNKSITKLSLKRYVVKDINDKDIGVRAQFDSTMSGTKTVHGIKFNADKGIEVPFNASYNTYNSDDYSNATSDTIAGSTVICHSADINGVHYDDYPFIKGGINFSVSKPGYITAIGATIVTSANSVRCFDLFEVKRSGENIESVKKISQIYMNGDDLETIEYNQSGAGTCVIDFTALTNLKKQYAYYFEIPVKKGDYVISASKDQTSTDIPPDIPTLMYLDIGANGEGESGGTVGLPYTMQSVDFVSVPTGFDDNNIIQTTKITDSNGNEVATYPAYMSAGFELAIAENPGDDEIYYKRGSYSDSTVTDGKINTKVYFWQLKNVTKVTPFPSDYTDTGTEATTKWN